MTEFCDTAPLTTYGCWQKQYIICWNVPIARSFSECQTKKKQRSHHIHQVETCRVSSEVPSHCFMGGVRVKLVIILSLLEEYSSILEKKKLWNHTLMHTSRTFLGTKKAISDNLVLVNTGLVPFSCSMNREIILGGIITVPLKSKLILETRTSHFEAQTLQVSRCKD